MSSDVATRRLRKELVELHNEPMTNPVMLVAPNESNLFEIHYVIDVGSTKDENPYQGGNYHGKLVFPKEYPMKPPGVIMLTPSGRFKTNQRLCLSLSDFHPESWSPAWTIRSILLGLYSFMLEPDTVITNGSIEANLTSTEHKRKLAQQSLSFNKRNPVFCQLFLPMYSDGLKNTVAVPAAAEESPKGDSSTVEAETHSLETTADNGKQEPAQDAPMQEKDAPSAKVVLSALESKVGTPRELILHPPLDLTQLSTLEPTRCHVIHLLYEGSVGAPDVDFRYRLTIVDHAKVLPTTRLQYATAMVLIPAGRESEYLWKSKRGLQQVAESAQCARLIAVALGRPTSNDQFSALSRTYGSTQEIQEELADIVRMIACQGQFLTSRLHAKLREAKEIPFLAVHGLGDRNVLARGTSVLSGDYIVEECQSGNTNDGDRYVRRLYFMSNPYVIQSEVGLVLPPAGTTSPAGGSELRQVDRAYVGFEYYQTLAAGILAYSMPPVQSNGGSDEADSTLSQVSGLLIGLGGGGLVNYFDYLTPISSSGTAGASSTLSHHLVVIELDPCVRDVAVEYFGLAVGPNVDVRIGDGLSVGLLAMADVQVQGHLQFPPASFDWIALDVDSKDSSVRALTGRRFPHLHCCADFDCCQAGMSCPPLSFVEISYLSKLKALLCPSGILAINVVARNPDMLAMVCRNVKKVFACVLLSSNKEEDDGDADGDVEGDETVNIILLALQTPANSLPARSFLRQRLRSALRTNLNDDEAVLSKLHECAASFKRWKDADDLTSANLKSSSKKASGKRSNRKKKK
jgi:ubiquitin-conjugating enzyme E2 J2